MSDRDARSTGDVGQTPDDTIDLAAGDPVPVYRPTEPPEAERFGFWEEPAPPARAQRTSGGVLAWFLAALLGAGVGGGAAYLALDGGGGVTAVRVTPPREPGQVAAPEDAAAQVAELVLPSIVQVQVGGPFGTGGLGSGVIFSPDGYILTNDHVVSGADDIEVNLPDGTSLPASVVGSAANVGVDIAVLKVVPDEPLASATFGNSSDLRVGELAVAIGSPFGLEATVTSGIISGLHRNDPIGGVRIIDAIQTDAAINQGNSGGALANSRGEVIGINTAIIGGTGGGNVGVGFAVPIDIARKVAEQLIEDGTAELAFLGISGDSLPGAEGARVREVESGSAADDAGLRAGDIIIRLDDEEIGSMDELIGLLIERDVGEQVTLTVLRDEEELTLTATLGARPVG